MFVRFLLLLFVLGFSTITLKDKAVLGTYKELVESGIDFASLLKERQKEEEKDDADDTCGIRKISKRDSVSSTVSVESEVIYANHTRSVSNRPLEIN